METKNLEVKPNQEIYRQQVLTIWEQSVLATQDFLANSDFQEIKQLVESINFNKLRRMTKGEITHS